MIKASLTLVTTGSIFLFFNETLAIMLRNLGRAYAGASGYVSQARRFIFLFFPRDVGDYAS